MKGPGPLERKALAVLGGIYVVVGVFLFYFFDLVTATDREPYVISVLAIVLGVGVWLALALTRPQR